MRRTNWRWLSKGAVSSCLSPFFFRCVASPGSNHSKIVPKPSGPGAGWSPILYPSASHQLKLRDQFVAWCACLLPTPTPYAGANLYWLVKEAMCVNNLSVITLDLSTWRVSITIALSLGIKYSMRDLIHDVDYCLCTRQCSGWDWTRNLQSQVQHPNHYATEPCTDSDNNLWWSWEPGFLLDVDTM